MRIQLSHAKGERFPEFQPKSTALMKNIKDASICMSFFFFQVHFRLSFSCSLFALSKT